MMGKYIVLSIIVVILFAPKVIWRIYIKYKQDKSMQEIVSKPFVCPNCGHRFYTQQRVIHPVGENKAILKCPSCGKRNVCGRPYDFDENS